MKFIQIPKTINFDDLKNEGSLSPSKYQTISLKNPRIKTISTLLVGKPKKGKEVGSSAYIPKSKFYFIRTRALQTAYFLPVLSDLESAVPILPSAFKGVGLEKGSILLSKDGNVGEVAYLDEDLSNYTLSAGVVRLLFDSEMSLYIFAFMKSDFFKDQILLKVSRGATLKHAKEVWLDAVVPFPKQKQEKEVITFVSRLTSAIIRREKEIKAKFEQAMDIIEDELSSNQKNKTFNYSNPNFFDLITIARLDAGIFCKEYKMQQFIVDNYKHGSKDIFNYGFDIKRGQNLQVSQIGKSIYSTEPKPNFYRLVRPLSLSDYGTIESYEYLGNSQNLLTLNRGEIIFSAEGTIGKFYVFINVGEKTITNIHGITIFKKEGEDDVESVFLAMFLAYSRRKEVLDYLSVGGQGGSLGEKYWKHIKIPNFPRSKKEEIAGLYYNSITYDSIKVKEFDKLDAESVSKAGIWQMDNQIKLLREKLDETIKQIADDKEVVLDFSFLSK